MLTLNFMSDTKMFQVHPLSADPCLQIKNDLARAQNYNKMSSLLDVSNGSSRPEEFNLNDIEVLEDSEEQNWFKRAHVGKFSGLVHIHRSTARLADEDQKTRAFFILKWGVTMRHSLGKMLKIMIFSSHLLVLFMSL